MVELALAGGKIYPSIKIADMSKERGKMLVRRNEEVSLGRTEVLQRSGVWTFVCRYSLGNGESEN